jgi:hypothetical protein
LTQISAGSYVHDIGNGCTTSSMGKAKVKPKRWQITDDRLVMEDSRGRFWEHLAGVRKWGEILMPDEPHASTPKQSAKSPVKPKRRESR